MADTYRTKLLSSLISFLVREIFYFVPSSAISTNSFSLYSASKSCNSSAYSFEGTWVLFLLVRPQRFSFYIFNYLGSLSGSNQKPCVTCDEHQLSVGLKVIIINARIVVSTCKKYCKNITYRLPSGRLVSFFD